MVRISIEIVSGGSDRRSTVIPSLPTVQRNHLSIYLFGITCSYPSLSLTMSNILRLLSNSVQKKRNKLVLEATLASTKRDYSCSGGIAAIEVYFPTQYVSQSELEKHDGVTAGKYTIGLGQNRMAFLATDREDTVSMCMTAVHNLLEKYEIDPREIGRMDVGSETPIDKSKSIKSNLMHLFSSVDHTDVEGIDSVHACYGGTSALLNGLYWLEANNNNNNKKKHHGKKQAYAIVVCGDVSNYKDRAARPSGGAGAVAMLLSANNDAPLVIDLQRKASHFEHVYDFYKPDPTSFFPIVDGHYSNVCYLRSLDKCYQRFLKTWDSNHGDLSLFQHVLFHSPYNKLVQKSLARLVYNDARFKNQLPHYLTEIDEETRIKTLPLLQLSQEESYTNKDVEKLFASLSAPIYKDKVEKSTLLSKELGNCYTASLYAGLASLIFHEGKNLENKNLALFSYGSGLASTMYHMKAVEVNGRFSLNRMQQVLDLTNRLENRIKISPEEYEKVIQSNIDRYHRCNYESNSSIDILPRGTYYLHSVDSLWRRVYKRK
jgi:hydroxymethylglutaryl-CoA synthase